MSIQILIEFGLEVKYLFSTHQTKRILIKWVYYFASDVPVMRL